MKYELYFRKKGQKRWLIASGTPECGYSSKKNALSMASYSQNYEHKVKKFKGCKK